MAEGLEGKHCGWEKYGGNLGSLNKGRCTKTVEVALITVNGNKLHFLLALNVGQLCVEFLLS